MGDAHNVERQVGLGLAQLSTHLSDGHRAHAREDDHPRSLTGQRCPHVPFRPAERCRPPFQQFGLRRQAQRPGLVDSVNAELGP
jgi:hypothetical protein